MTIILPVEMVAVQIAQLKQLTIALSTERPVSVAIVVFIAVHALLKAAANPAIPPISLTMPPQPACLIAH